jgi:hypothetical protein
MALESHRRTAAWRKKSRSSVIAGAVAFGIAAGLAGHASAVTLSSFTKETRSGFDALNGTDASYGTNSMLAVFPDGPMTVLSGIAANLTTTSKGGTQDSILLVLTALNPLTGNEAITLTFGDSLPGGTSHSATFRSSDFFTTAQAGFSSSDFNSGTINNIGFFSNDAIHAGVDITYSGALPTSTRVGTVSISSPIDLRVDVFGDKAGRIMSHSPNSGGEAIHAPEPSSLLVMAGGLLALFRARPRKPLRTGDNAAA